MYYDIYTLNIIMGLYVLYIVPRSKTTWYSNCYQYYRLVGSFIAIDNNIMFYNLSITPLE